MISNFIFNNKIFQLSQISLSILFPKIYLIILAYLLKHEQYNNFNLNYYNASLLILIGTLGSNYVFPRYSIDKKFLNLFVGLNIIGGFIIISLISKQKVLESDFIFTFIYSYCITIGGLMNFYFLYHGKVNKYFYYQILLFLLQILSLLISLTTNIALFKILTVFVLVWSLIIYFRFNLKGRFNLEKSFYLYSRGLYIFIINSAVTIILQTEKVIINQTMSMFISNSYIFAWSIIAPIYYIGNIIEKYLLSLPQLKKLSIKLFIINGTLVFSYLLTIYLFFINCKQILPKIIDFDHFINIFLIMVIGHGTFVTINFPLNSILLKFMSSRYQKKFSKLLLVALLLFFSCIFVYSSIRTEMNYIHILLITFTFIFIILYFKFSLVYRNSKKITNFLFQMI